MGSWVVWGAIAGSVANAVIWRLPRGQGWWPGRSACPHCGRTLAWWELVPVVSWLGLAGKCSRCRRPIGVRYLLVELVMAAGFGLLAPINLLLVAIFWLTVVIAAIDWETRLVNEGLVAAWAALVFVSNLGNLGNLSHLGGAAAASALIGGIWAVSRGRAMGWGDVEIAAVMGWWLGWPLILPALMVAFVSGAVVGVALVVKRQVSLKSQIAFGPFLIAGAWVGYFWGDILVG